MKKLLIVISSAFFLSACSLGTSTEMGAIPTPVESVEQNNKLVEYQCEQGKNAFELLEQNNHTVEFTESTFGKLITNIDGQPQGDGKYWLYDVDDKEATVGAEAYTCQNQEKIQWELR